MQTNDQTSSGDEGAPSLLRRVVFWGLLALIFLAPLKFGNPIATQATQYPPRTLGEWTVSLALEFVALPVSCHAWLGHWFVCAVLGLYMLANWDRNTLLCWLGFKWREQRAIFPLSLCLVAFFVAQLLGLQEGANVESWHDVTATFASYVLLAFVTSRFAMFRETMPRIVAVMAFSVFAVCWFGITQQFLTMQSLPPWEEVYRVVGTGPDAARVMQKYADKRIFSTLVYPNTLGGFLALASPMVFAALWQWRHRLTRGAMIAAAIFLGAILAAVLGSSRSNGAFLAVGVSLGATLLLWRTGWKKKILLAGCAVLLLAGFFALAYGPKRISGGTATFSARLDYWRAAVDLAAQRPLTGWGAGAFGDLYTRYIKGEEFAGGRLPEEPRMAHNGFLQVAADSGLVGAAGYAGIWILAMIGAARLYRRRSAEKSGDAGLWLAVFAGLVAWTTHDLLDFDLYVPGVAAYAFVLAGLVLGAQWRDGIAASQSEERQVSRVDPRIKVWAGRVAATVVFGALLVWFVRVSVANYYYVEAKELMFEGNAGFAAPVMAEARRLAPQSVSYKSFSGDVHLAMGELEEAEKFFHAATVFAPERASNHYRAAIVRWRRLQRVDEFVMNGLRRAVELYPANPTYRAALAEAEKMFDAKPSE
jgi:O-antigen ligase